MKLLDLEEIHFFASPADLDNIIINSLLNGDDYHTYGIDYNSMSSMLRYEDFY